MFVQGNKKLREQREKTTIEYKKEMDAITCGCVVNKKSSNLCCCFQTNFPG